MSGHENDFTDKCECCKWQFAPGSLQHLRAPCRASGYGRDGNLWTSKARSVPQEEEADRNDC